MKQNYKELYKEKLAQAAEAADSMEEIDAAYQAGRIEALLSIQQQKQTAAEAE